MSTKGNPALTPTVFSHDQTVNMGCRGMREPVEALRTGVTLSPAAATCACVPRPVLAFCTAKMGQLAAAAAAVNCTYSPAARSA